jgi:hypothetical protein
MAQDYNSFIAGGGSPNDWWNMPENGGTGGSTWTDTSGNTFGNTTSSTSSTPTDATASALSGDQLANNSVTYDLSGNGTPNRTPSGSTVSQLSGPLQPAGGTPGSTPYTPSGNYGTVNTNPIPVTTNTTGNGPTPNPTLPQGLVPLGNTGPSSTQLPPTIGNVGGAIQSIQDIQALQGLVATPPANTPPAGSANWTPTQWNNYYNSQPGVVNALGGPGFTGTTQNLSPYTATIANPTGSGPNGTTTNYNPNYFPTQDAANAFVKQYGGTVVPGNYLTGAQGSPFSLNQQQYYVQMPDGRIVNPADLSYAANSSGANQQALINSVVTGATTPNSYNPALANTNPANQLPSGPGSPSTIGTTYNPFTQQPVPNTAAQLSGLPQETTAPYPATTAPYPDTTSPVTGTGATNTVSPSASDLQSLMNALLYLQGYQGLGNGAGNPQAINTNGQLGNQLSSVLTAMLSGLYGPSTLYSRQRLYSQFP